MKMQKMFTGLVIVAAMLIAGAAMATNTVLGYGHNTAGTNTTTQLGSGSTIATALAVEDVSMIRIYGSALTIDITPYTTASSVNSSPIALRFDSNFNETFTIALTSTSSLPLPGRWTITSTQPVSGAGPSSVAVVFATNTTGAQGSGTASATFAYNGASGEYNGATTGSTTASTWASAPVTNIGLTVTDIDMNTAANPISVNSGDPPAGGGVANGAYAGTLTFTTSTGF
jgi:hypothetical protein